MKLILTKRGLRLYINKTTYIKVERILFLLLAFISIIKVATTAYTLLTHECKCEPTKEVVYVNFIEKEQEKTSEENIEVESSTTISKVEKEQKEESNKRNEGLKYRMTYYYTGDSTNSTNITASGKSTNNFKVNEYGWYTYNGKLVVATAHNSLKSWSKYSNSTEPTYSLYDELVLTINGIDYDAIVLDKCGSCMLHSRIDLFVKDKASGLDTNITVRKK